MKRVTGIGGIFFKAKECNCASCYLRAGAADKFPSAFRLFDCLTRHRMHIIPQSADTLWRKYKPMSLSPEKSST
jgi:hypothetical protein